MANIVVVLDKDPNRRERFLEAVGSRICPLPQLEVTHRQGDGWVAAWAAHASAPVSVRVHERDATFLWGEAADPTGQRLTADGIHEQWRGDGLPTWDGFHLALEVSGADHLTASVDILGFMPLYYWQGAGVSLVGTSVDLFRAHPAFDAGLDVTGMVGILLVNSLAGSRTLWQGVRRLGVRQQLRIRNGTASEVEHFAFPEPDRYLLGLPLEGHVEIMADALDRCFGRLKGKGQPEGMLLSGGLDSRQIGGFLQDQGIELQALTFGLDEDIEMRCARSVAREIGARHCTVEVPAGEYPRSAEALLKSEGLATGFGNVLDWGMVPFFDRVPSRLWIGHAFDGVVGGIHLPWAYDSKALDYTKEAVLGRLYRWAFSPEQLREALEPEFHPAIEDVLRDLGRLWEAGTEHTNLRAWNIDLLLRQRYNVGGAVWPMTFRAWPVSPIFDQTIFRLAVSIPASSMHARRLQTELLLSRKPKLAAIPLDRNSYDSLPLRPTLGDRVRAKVAGKWQRTLRRGIGPWKRESRFYYRTYDFDSPAWRGVRAAFESDRAFVPGPLRREAITKYLPAPDRALDTRDGIIDSSKAKLLLGLGMAGRHFGLG